MPQVKHKHFEFPSEAYLENPLRPYETLGVVRSKVNFQTLDANSEENVLCKNYYNKAVQDLVDRAHEKGADAVIDVKSVVFLQDGRREFYKTPECADDGDTGQILTQGIAVKWKPLSLPGDAEDKK